MIKKQARHKRREYSAPKLEMSSMIDVVFLLLIFFVVITKPQDIMAKFECSRPAPSADQDEPIKPTTTIDIVDNRYYVFNHEYKLETLSRKLGRIRGLGDETTLIITSDSTSTHSSMVRLLDMCAELKIKNLAVMSR